MGADTQERRIGVFVEAGFQEIEFWYPVLRLREAGYAVTVLGPRDDVQVESQLGYPVIPETDFNADGDWAGLIVPGGAMASRVAENTGALRLLTKAAAAGVVLGATGQGVRVLARAGLLNGRRVACLPSIEMAVRADGGEPSTDEVVAEAGLITARSADGMPGFYRAFESAIFHAPARRVAA